MARHLLACQVEPPAGQADPPVVTQAVATGLDRVDRHPPPPGRRAASPRRIPPRATPRRARCRGSEFPAIAEDAPAGITLSGGNQVGDGSATVQQHPTVNPVGEGHAVRSPHGCLECPGLHHHHRRLQGILSRSMGWSPLAPKWPQRAESIWPHTCCRGTATETGRPASGSWRQSRSSSAPRRCQVLTCSAHPFLRSGIQIDLDRGCRGHHRRTGTPLAGGEKLLHGPIACAPD